MRKIFMGSKSKIVIIIIAIIAILVLFYTIFFSLISYVEREKNIKRCEIVESILMQDEVFESEYGEVQSITYDGSLFFKKFRGVADEEIELKCILTNKQGDTFRFIIIFNYIEDMIVSYNLIS